MREAKSKFSKDKSQSGSCSKPSSNATSASGCHCKSKQASGEVEKKEVIEIEEK